MTAGVSRHCSFCTANPLSRTLPGPFSGDPGPNMANWLFFVYYILAFRLEIAYKTMLYKELVPW